MILVMTGTVLALMLSCGWFLLPRWTPGLVIRWSPWVEPVVAAGGHLHASGGLGDLTSEYRGRFEEWGEDAFPVLARCLDGPPNLRAASIEAFPIRVPVSRGGPLYDTTWYILHVSCTIIHDRGGPWYRVRADGRTLAAPLYAQDLGGLTELRDHVSRIGNDPQIGLLADGRPRLMAEVRLDGAVPYGVAAEILAASGYVQDPPVDIDQPSSSLAVVVAKPPASYFAEERTVLFNPGGRVSHLITIELTQRPDGRIDIKEDGKPRLAVEGTPSNSVERLHQFRHAFAPRPEPSGFTPNPVVLIRATPDVAWSDVVAACDAQYPLRSVILGRPLDRPEKANPSGDAGGVGDPSSSSR